MCLPLCPLAQIFWVSAVLTEGGFCLFVLPVTERRSDMLAFSNQRSHYELVLQNNNSFVWYASKSQSPEPLTFKKQGERRGRESCCPASPFPAELQDPVTVCGGYLKEPASGCSDPSVDSTSGSNLRQSRETAAPQGGPPCGLANRGFETRCRGLSGAAPSCNRLVGTTF